MTLAVLFDSVKRTGGEVAIQLGLRNKNWWTDIAGHIHSIALFSDAGSDHLATITVGGHSKGHHYAGFYLPRKVNLTVIATFSAIPAEATKAQLLRISIAEYHDGHSDYHGKEDSNFDFRDFLL